MVGGHSSIGQAASPTEAAVGGAPSTGATAADATSDGVQFTEQAASITPALRRQSGTTQVVVQLESADISDSMSRRETISTLKAHAERTQQSVLLYAKKTDGVRVEGRFWLANAVLLEVDTDQVDLEEIARIKYVEQLHSNFEVDVVDGGSTSAAGATEAAVAPDDTEFNTTPEIDLINASQVWAEYDTKGQGVDVAVLDTGVDPDHPDIQESFQSFVQVNDDGSVDADEPAFDSGSHGTHVSGTVVGDNESGEYIGVAPEADLMMGQVLWSGGSTFAAIVGGMEWAVSNDADVISMSLGCINAPCYTPAVIEPVQNAQSAGVVVVAASGNSGDGTSVSPGNVYEAVAVGAVVDDGQDAASFSGGEVVDTDADWGSDAPADWPATYLVPDFVAPGVEVCSSVPGGGYDCTFSGTSMATPHVSGTIALMLSAGGDLQPATVKQVLNDTARFPGDAERGTRYGDGLIDAKAAVDVVALDQGVNGTVTGSDTGAPISGATVEASNGFSDTTGANGEYSILAESGSLTLTADAFGYEETTATTTVPNGSFATEDIALDPALEIAPREGQAGAIGAGDSVSVVVDVANVETLTVDLQGNYSEDNATLSVDGQQASFGEPVELDGDGTVTVTVETADGTSGTFSLQHTFAGLNDSVTVTTGPTTVYESLIQVGVVHTGDFGDQVEAALADELPGRFVVDTVLASNATDRANDYDVFVVQDIEPGQVGPFVDATDDMTTGVVWLDNWGSDSDAIPAKSEATGDPETTGAAFGGGIQPAFVNADADHPIFDGVDTSDGVTIHTGGFTDHSWFSGTDAQVLAEVTDDAGEVSGSAIAYESTTNTVLASSLGREQFVQNADFTDAADTVLANTVEFTADQRPSLAGETVITDAEVPPGGTATVMVKTTAPGVAGYEMNVSYNASKVTVVDVTGIDMADPVVNIDNQQGWVKMAQTQTQPVDGPVMVKIEFDATMQNRSDSTPVEFVPRSQLVDADGQPIMTTYEDGRIEVANLSGDVDGDGEVTIADATLVQQYIVGNPIEGPFDEDAADVNDDGSITSADVTAILQIVVGNEDPDDFGSVERADGPSAAVDGPADADRPVSVARAG